MYVKPLTAAVLVALGEMRFGRYIVLDLDPRKGLHVRQRYAG